MLRLNNTLFKSKPFMAPNRIFKFKHMLYNYTPSSRMMHNYKTPMIFNYKINNVINYKLPSRMISNYKTSVNFNHNLNNVVCGDECNPSSQTCGRMCARQLTGFSLGWNPHPQTEQHENKDDSLTSVVTPTVVTVTPTLPILETDSSTETDSDSSTEVDSSSSFEIDSP